MSPGSQNLVSECMYNTRWLALYRLTNRLHMGTTVNHKDGNDGNKKCEKADADDCDKGDSNDFDEGDTNIRANDNGNSNADIVNDCYATNEQWSILR